MRSRSQQRLRLFGLVAPLLLVFAFAVMLALQAQTATRLQRETAERTLTDFADFAAFIISNTARQELERRLLYAFGPLRRYDAASGEPLPPPSVLGEDRVEARRCAAVGPATPTFVRLTPADGLLEVEGQPLPDASADWLADTLSVVAHSATGGSVSHLFGGRAGVGLLAWTVLADTDDQPIAVYGKTTCLSIDSTSIFALAARSTPALPPSLTGALPNDSLLAIRATSPAGEVLYESRTLPEPGVVGEAVMAPFWGGARLAVEIRPEIADRLVIGGVPYGGVPLAMLLLALIVLFASLAIVQARRQQELVRLRERFISNVSHELRTPLQQILVFAELLRMEKLESPAERRHSVEVVERETRRLIDLVENVLRFSRASRADDPLVLESVPLEPLIRETIQAFEPLAKANGTEVILRVEQSATVRADAGAVRRVLLNLLDNAVKYGPAAQTVLVRVTAGSTASAARLIVEDQGAGVPRPDRERVWKPFQRLDREEQAAIAGSGMGLAIVRDLVERMAGHTSIEDGNDGGARFIVELPLADRV